MNFKDKLSLWLDQWAIDDWRHAWDKLTIKWNVVLIAAGVAWNALPNEAQTKIIESVLTIMGVPTSWAVVAIGLVGLFFRLKSQTPKE